MDTLVFFESPAVTIATNTFINVPVILQYEDTPLISIVKVEKAGYTTELPIYSADGAYLAKVVGSRLFTTEVGKKSGLILKYPKDMTVCELDGKTLFEIHRTGAAALKANAELFTPDGSFVKCHADLAPKLIIGINEQSLRISGVELIGNTISGFRIGILIMKDGRLGIGVNNPPKTS